MPKGKGSKAARGQKPSPSTGSQVTQCQTLDQDEITRCNNPATDGYPHPERCKEHQSQYRKLYTKYKAAAKIVDDTKKGREIPTKGRIQEYTDLGSTLKKARWMREYLEAIRVEKMGREIHGKRFFLKIDDGHKIRMKVLEKQMIEAVEALDALQERAFTLRVTDDPAKEWIDEFQSSDVLGDEHRDLLSTANIINRAQVFASSTTRDVQPVVATTAAIGAEKEDEGVGPPELDALDLIEIELRRQKKQLLHAFEPFMNLEATTAHPENPALERISRIIYHSLQQYARRIVFHEPVLFLKALDKVSFKDLLLDEDFSHEDAARFALVFKKRLEIGILWWKDSVLEAIEMESRAGTAANMGNPSNRFKILGGWIFNRTHTKTTSNEAWFTLIKCLDPPANIENRFVRLCNNFDDLIGCLSFGALGLLPPPAFCQRSNCVAFRNHLSLSGVIVTDMVSSHSPPSPIPSLGHRSNRPGCIVWGQLESRAYMFGAVRNEPDAFTRAFFDELRARPDLFQVVTRSDTDPGREVESFGDSGGVLPQMRTRMFDAPPRSSPQADPPSGHGPWDVLRSAVDVLYGTTPMNGYLTSLNRPNSSGWFFHFKKMPVKYFVVLDTSPGRDVSFLAREVAWAALRAQGLGRGEYEPQKYAEASDILFQKSAEQRLAWMPKELGGWYTTKMAKS